MDFLNTGGRFKEKLTEYCIGTMLKIDAHPQSLSTTLLLLNHSAQLIWFPALNEHYNLRRECQQGEWHRRQ